MRVTGLILVAVCSAAQLLGQTVHHVCAGSTGNQLEIEVANQGSGSPLSNVEVTVTPGTPFVCINARRVVLPSVAPGGGALARFQFNVQRKAPIGGRDTLWLSVAGGAGGSIAEKLIVLQFDGPDVYRMEQNYPNPFNPSTTIQYQLPEESRVELVLYDLLGRRTAVVLDEVRPAGFHETVIDGRALASGAYFCRMEASSTKSGIRFTDTKRILLIR